ncbi:MAG: M6 family metalloprotease domain-containing protein [Bacteroidales bacterium]|nr:M6 family metalloprotease domain-containing protein [Bacteroidales bacterium]
MKRNIIKQLAVMMLLLAISINLLAIPANPVPITIKQPNGKLLTLTPKGDEKVNWASTTDRYTLVRNNESVFVYGQLNEEGDLIPSRYIASNPDQRSKQESEFLSTLPYDLRYSNKQIKEKIDLFDKGDIQHKSVTSGTAKLLLVLVDFSDKPFTFTQSDFYNLCNQVGYSANGATGSVKDYYRDNSNGALNMEIDVVGPITLPNTSAYYANNRMQAFVSGALNAIDGSVDFSQYLNGETKVSNVHFVFAGRSQASTQDPTEIWPHKSTISNNIVKDGVRFSSYSCSSEKKSSTEMDGIGVMCHEMGHSLGLMDLYDTDYAGTGGTSYTPGPWCLMDAGSYNNNSNTPPFLNAWERKILGWGNPIVLTTTSTGILPAMADSLTSYQIPINNYEYFLLEHRKQKSWDAFVPGNGLIIYHADSRLLEGTNAFYSNDINIDPTNKGFYIEVSTGNPSQSSSSYAPFVGMSGKDYFTNESMPQSIDKNGNPTNRPITHIEYINDSTISFSFLSDLPQVITQAVDPATINSVSATVNGAMVYMGNGQILEKGMYWHTDPDSVNVESGNKVISNSQDSLITTHLTNLPSSTLIHFRAFVSNADEVYLANQVLYFTTTDGLGVIMTSNPNSIGNTSAILNGSILDVGDGVMISKGFVYTTDPSILPTLNDSVIVITDTSTGAYSFTLEGLEEQTTYYYRAYLLTSIGVKYGSKRTFTTTFPEILSNVISDNQSFCGQGTPQELIGLTPTGGYGDFTYIWEQKTRNNVWEPASQTNNQINYQPETLTDSTYYRRIVFSNNIKDTSNVVLINVKNSWGGIVNSPWDTINQATTTGAIRLTNHVGTIKNWERKKDDGDWTTISHTTSQLTQIIDTSGLYTYRVKVQKDECPEVYSSEKQILVQEVAGLSDIDFNIDMRIYPNPTKGNITITSSYTNPVQLRIVNSLGQIVRMETTPINNKTLDLSNLESGNYLITISSETKQSTKSIIINK